VQNSGVVEGWEGENTESRKPLLNARDQEAQVVELKGSNFATCQGLEKKEEGKGGIPFAFRPTALWSLMLKEKREHFE